MTDREKFTAWLAQCPVKVLKTEDFANGYTEVHVRCQDEEDEDWRFPWERKYDED